MQVCACPVFFWEQPTTKHPPPPFIHSVRGQCGANTQTRVIRPFRNKTFRLMRKKLLDSTAQYFALITSIHRRVDSTLICCCREKKARVARDIKATFALRQPRENFLILFLMYRINK